MITEDMAGWDCATMGNLICGLPDTAMPADGVAFFFYGLALLAMVAAAVLRRLAR